MSLINELVNSKLPHAFIPFSSATTESFIPSIEEGIKRVRESVEKIKSSKSSDARFETVILPYEKSFRDLSLVTNLFYGLLNNLNNPKMMKIAEEVSPKLSTLDTDLLLDEVLFEKIEQAYQNEKENSDLGAEEKMLLTKTYRHFVNNGARLKGESRKKLKEISEKLSLLSLDFGNKHVAALDEEVALNTKKDEQCLEGIPEVFVKQAEEAAKKKKMPKGNYLFSLHMPIVVSVMKNAVSEKTRLAFYDKTRKLCHGGKFDNDKNVFEIVKLRLELAQLLGYSSYAEMILQERMAGKVETVSTFLNDFVEKSIRLAKEDVSKLEELKGEKLNPWDLSFYLEKYRLQELAFNDAVLKPYFQLDKVLSGLFQLLGKLYDIDFKKDTNLSLYHKDAEVFHVFNKQGGTFIGSVVTDLYSRSEKHSGAWMNDYRKQSAEDRPIVGINCNFQRGSDGDPTLLDFREVETLFHEFGHGMHGLLANGKYDSLTGTSVYWDFVELPSQLMENFLYEDEILDLVSEHVETKEKISKDLKDKIRQGRSFFEGYQTLRQTSLGLMDMAWHSATSLPIKGPEEVESFEKKVLERTQLFEPIAGTCFSTSFSHLFQGGYGAGYYSYKWAEVLEADLYEFFKKDKKVDFSKGQIFREKILEKGGSVDPMELFVSLRGREPKIDYLFNRSFPS